ncbi:MAG: (d)CMP kinase [Gemmatimonadetes bacterium]|nr:(d)CMP kinase [Gemmatimonadota bacterium]
MTSPRVIAIDGPAGSGKTTTARAVAQALGFAHLDSGALYRAVTLAALDLSAGAGAALVLAAAEQARAGLVRVGDEFRPEAGGVDVSQAIRSDRVTRQVSAIAALPAVRDWVNRKLRAAAAAHPVGVVVDGRDIGTVVFPDAPLKVFLTAAPEERAKRRLSQEGRVVDRESVGRTSRQLQSRDAADSTRTVAPLRPAPDAVVLDTTSLSFAEQVDQIVQRARQVFRSEVRG